MQIIKANKLLILTVAIFLLLNNLPLLIGAYKTLGSADEIYNGSSVLNNPDYFVYLSMIEMGKQGHLIMKNPYNHEGQRPVFVSPQWYVIGQFAKYAGISTTVSYHLFRLAASLIFLYMLWWWIKKIFTEHKKRITTLMTVLLAGGLGIIFVDIFSALSLKPTDLYMPESNTFLNLSQSPLFIISQALLLAIFALFIQKKYWLVSILTFYLSLIHPYDAVIIICLTSVWTIIKAKNNRKILLKLIYVYLPILPIAFYYYVIFSFDKAALQWKMQNITVSGNILEYLIGFGIFSILFIVGLRLTIKNKLYKNDYLLFLSIWAALGWVLVYLPVNFNRRLANGWHIPIIILSMMAIFWLYQKTRPLFKQALIPLLVMLGFFGTMVTIITESIYVQKNYQDNFFNTKYDLEIYKFIKNIAEPDDIILTRGRLGNILPAYTGLTVYVGHGHQTWQVETKTKEVVDLWTSQTDISAWLKAKNISYIFASQKYTPEFGQIRWLANQPYIRVLIDNQEFILYEVTIN